MKAFIVISILIISNLGLMKSNQAEEIKIWENVVQQKPDFQKFTTVNALVNGSPELSWEFFSRLHWQYRFDPQGKDLVRKAGRAIGKNVEVQALLEARFEQKQREFQKENPYLLTLGGIPTSWSARILGNYLLDPTPMDPNEMSSDVQSLPNQAAAAWGLSEMGFSDAPTTGPTPDLGGGKLQAWKNWWIANEARIDDRIREINPDYLSKQTMSRVPAASLIPKPSVAVPSLKIAEPKMESLNFYFLVGGGLLIIVALGIVVEWWRRR